MFPWMRNEVPPLQHVQTNSALGGVTNETTHHEPWRTPLWLNLVKSWETKEVVKHTWFLDMKADDKRFQFEEDYQKRANHQSYLNTRTIARPRGINRNRTTLQENGKCVINGKRNETNVLRIPWRVMSLQEPRKLKVLKRLYTQDFFRDQTHIGCSQHPFLPVRKCRVGYGRKRKVHHNVQNSPYSFHVSEW